MSIGALEGEGADANIVRAKPSRRHSTLLSCRMCSQGLALCMAWQYRRSASCQGGRHVWIDGSEMQKLMHDSLAHPADHVSTFRLCRGRVAPCHVLQAHERCPHCLCFLCPANEL